MRCVLSSRVTRCARSCPLLRFPSPSPWRGARERGGGRVRRGLAARTGPGGDGHHNAPQLPREPWPSSSPRSASTRVFPGIVDSARVPHGEDRTVSSPRSRSNPARPAFRQPADISSAAALLAPPTLLHRTTLHIDARPSSMNNHTEDTPHTPPPAAVWAHRVIAAYRGTASPFRVSRRAYAAQRAPSRERRGQVARQPISRLRRHSRASYPARCTSRRAPTCGRPAQCCAHRARCSTRSGTPAHSTHQAVHPGLPGQHAAP